VAIVAGLEGNWSCLMYHEVPLTVGRGSESYFAVQADRFADQMTKLRDLGLRGVSLETLFETQDSNVVALTFDDGHATHYTSAFPILTGLGFTATFFITTSWVGSHPYLSWSQLKEMAAAGMSIQSHTVSHPFLSALDEAAVGRELRESKRQLDERLGQDTITLSLPGGDAPQRKYANLIATSGYRVLATSAWGPNAASLRGSRASAVVRRYTVREDTSIERFMDLALGRSPSWSREGIRLRALHGIRTVLGAGRYARWRSAFLKTVRG